VRPSEKGSGTRHLRRRRHLLVVAGSVGLRQKVPGGIAPGIWPEGRLRTGLRRSYGPGKGAIHLRVLPSKVRPRLGGLRAWARLVGAGMDWTVYQRPLARIKKSRARSVIHQRDVRTYRGLAIERSGLNSRQIINWDESRRRPRPGIQTRFG